MIRDNDQATVRAFHTDVLSAPANTTKERYDLEDWTSAIAQLTAKD